MRALEQQRGSGLGTPYPLDAYNLPFLLRFAQRRHIKDLPVLRAGTTESDGQTTGNDGGEGGSEEFDWLTDD